MKRTLTILSALLLTTPAFAAGVPVGCTNGTRNEPQPPTIIPAYTEVVPDIEHEAYVEITPDIQHDGYIEVVPDIVHPAYTEVVPDIIHPEQIIPHDPLKVAVGGGNAHSHTAGNVCILPNGWRSPGLKADCLTPQNVNSMASEVGKGFKLVQVKPTVIPESVEVVPDIDHPETVEVVADIEHAPYVEDVPDIPHDAYTEVVPDIEHPEQSIPNPDLVIDTKTVKYLDFYDWKPVFKYVTTDGTCPSH